MKKNILAHPRLFAAGLALFGAASALFVDVSKQNVFDFKGVRAMAQDKNVQAASSADFALDLFRREASDLSKNIVVSPFSAYEALSMAANGAAGATKKQMEQVLGGGLDIKLLNERNHKVLLALNSNSAVQMEIANAIYADSSTRFRSSFISLCRDVYQAEAKSENFNDPATVTKINTWCDQKTHGKIKKIISSLSSAEKMVLLNSVYFKGTWQKPFKAESTRQQDFKLLKGATKEVAMMYESTDLQYYEGGGFQAVAIPYAGHRQNMYIFLPSEGADFAAFQAKFTSKDWNSWMSSLSSSRSKKVDLAMPKYTVAFSTELNKTLKAMGMTDAFGAKADFSEMFEGQPGAISRVLQKTYIDVDEKGTEAAAVTAVGMQSRAMMQVEPPIKFTVDRPFVVALTDQDSGEILFLGSIVDPTLK